MLTLFEAASPVALFFPLQPMSAIDARTNTVVIDKSFFIVVPYHTGGVIPDTSILKSKKTKEQEIESVNIKTDQLIEKARIFLYPKRDHILKQLTRMGLTGHQLTTKDLISEFYVVIFNLINFI